MIVSSSIIHSSALIGKNVKIGRFCIIERDVVIGDDSIAGDYTVVQSGSKIGSNNNLGTFTKIGHDVEIGDNCSFTSYCEIRDKCKIGDNVLMGSRCTLSAGVIVESNVNIKYSTVVTDTPDLKNDKEKKTGILKQGAMIGANVTIMPGVNIGRNSVLGACSQIRHDVPDDEVWYGNPAKCFKKNNLTIQRKLKKVKKIEEKA